MDWTTISTLGNVEWRRTLPNTGGYRYQVLVAGEVVSDSLSYANSDKITKIETSCSVYAFHNGRW